MALVCDSWSLALPPSSPVTLLDNRAILQQWGAGAIPGAQCGWMQCRQWEPGSDGGAAWHRCAPGWDGLSQTVKVTATHTSLCPSHRSVSDKPGHCTPLGWATPGHHTYTPPNSKTVTLPALKQHIVLLISLSQTVFNHKCQKMSKT